MSFGYLTNKPLEEALEEYLTELRQRGLTYKTETIPVPQADGRVTARPVYAKISAPHYHASAMDGIAVYAKTTFGASETTPVKLAPDQYQVVDTGDALPEGFDAVVMVEDVVRAEGGVLLHTAATPWQHVRQIGEDICEGDMLLHSFTTITPAALGAMLACGNLEVEVVRRPSFAIIPTGDEIVAPSLDPKAGDIMEFNSSIFAAMLRRWGALAKVWPVVKDDPALLEKAVRDALARFDGVIINGGSSAGREDYTTQTIEAVGEVFTHGVAIRPGKPVVLGSSRQGKPIMGVPGYPVSGILVLEKLLRPVVEEMEGLPKDEPAPVRATISRALNSSLKYREFIRTRLGMVNGKLVAAPLTRGAGVVTSFVKADGIIDVPQDVEGYEAGSQVTVQLLRPLEEIERTLVITGSHDPLIDETAELMRRRWHNAAVASSHVGSMGGIFALRRGEAHMGGIHLLDENSGVYNVAYIRKHFPDGGVLLVECVRRVQGLMVPAGNPLGLSGLADLTREGVCFVNRQKGSGTRVLCDYICKRDGIDSSQIYGYDREEYTHTAVAALVASGSADAGLGIYSAAKIYGLEFIPVCTEKYDFLLLKEAYGLSAVQRWLETMKSPEFAARLAEMGGYEMGRPGAIEEF
ncbi:molybdopterin biosynthesis protein [Ruminococcaceae bacterium OttesenSCG-928-A11]|nr:molybdopterin biosynthesis protein [Ruminococcaceae bacterium OttesenSCG-928-A11]